MALASERQELILALVRQSGTVRLADLVERLGVTAVTVRRDVTLLADRGLVQRVHGGVTRPSHPTPSAPTRPSGHTLIGMVVPTVEFYWPSVIKGAQGAVAAADGRLALRASAYDAREDRRQVAGLLDRGARALLVAPTVAGDAGADLLRWLGTLPVPVVLVERLPPPTLPTLALDAATTAHDLGAGLAVRHLVTLGHRRIAFITARFSPTTHALREGWRTSAAALGLEAPTDLEFEVPPYGSRGWTDTYDDVLRRCREARATALFIHSDGEAIGMVERARDHGLSVPGDLAVVSYDDEVAATSDPPLTAVRPPKHQLGTTAADLALSRLTSPPTRPIHRVHLWPTLVIRASCGAPGQEGAEGDAVSG
ncbi:LacI family transcriptional regulator [Streptomyces spiroverticillatus]|uniref:LacI family transcriptional regulator n=1 Tax=Streptomyces finlayi TaxID=67296 RepID=A0A918WVR0_9ACTN|nr:substrate-binding domain-containing protein [Streptomyces finlayi]GHA03603.1 LacI family transcriptional regulator [Streptomyces spiroverticillatus]GHC87750.1 LacI family transcriptional regulator [Streptomyces finlayi]